SSVRRRERRSWARALAGPSDPDSLAGQLRIGELELHVERGALPADVLEPELEGRVRVEGEVRDLDAALERGAPGVLGEVLHLAARVDEGHLDVRPFREEELAAREPPAEHPVDRQRRFA